MGIGLFLIGAIAMCGASAASASPAGDRAGCAARAAEPACRSFAVVGLAGPASGAPVLQTGTLLPADDSIDAPESGPGGQKSAPDGAPGSARAFVDELFHRLQTSSDPQEARGIAGVIERFWLHSGSDTADLLMERAIAAMQAHEFDLALTLLGRIIELEPGWAEAWNKRATLRFEMDDLNGSMQDIQKVLSLEPRHFGALSGMGMILQREGLDKRALQAFRQLLEIYPTMESIRQITDKLSIQVEGRGI